MKIDWRVDLFFWYCGRATNGGTSRTGGFVDNGIFLPLWRLLLPGCGPLVSPFPVLSVGFGLASLSGITVFFGAGEELELMWQIGFGVFLAGLVWAMFRIFND